MNSVDEQLGVFEDVANLVSDLQSNGVPKHEKDHRSRILTPDNLEDLAEQAWDALGKGNTPPRLFRFGSGLSRIEINDDGVARLRDLNVYRLRHELARAAQWAKITKDGTEGCSPPIDVVQDMLATPAVPLPPLHRLVGVPTFAADGTLIDQPGYHARTKIYLDPNGLRIPPLPQEPTQIDLDQAKKLLAFPFKDFSFVAESDKAHAFGLALLALARELIPGPTPLHLIEGPIPGSGKGLLADAALIPSVGRHIGVIAEARSDEEWRKRLTACFREGYPVILLDNISRPVDSGVLAAALTSIKWSDRLLGKNETLSFPVRSIWVMTANNPVITTEMARRSIRIRLDPKVDRPWLLEDFLCPNLRGFVQENRSNLVWAALVLIQAWIVAGRPKPTAKPLGSFESWSEVIGGILEHAEIPGFLDNLSQFYEATDLEGSTWRIFFQAWWDEYEDHAVGTADLFRIAEDIESFNLGRGQKERAMKTALGKQLSKQRDRVIGDFRLLSAGTVSRASQWRLARVGSDTPPKSSCEGPEKEF